MQKSTNQTKAVATRGSNSQRRQARGKGARGEFATAAMLKGSLQYTSSRHTLEEIDNFIETIADPVPETTCFSLLVVVLTTAPLLLLERRSNVMRCYRRASGE